MTSPTINRIEIQGFRAFGKKPQELVLSSLLAAVWAPNSKGKTSLAEACEFLLTGQIVRRQLMASTQDEFADALRNAHAPANLPVYVESQITGSDGKAHTLRRTLTTDYGKRHDCESRLEIDGRPATPDDLTALGIVLSQPPLSAPVLAQHTLGYLFSARPQDRATYFKTILEVTDLEELRRAVAALDGEFMPGDNPLWTKLLNAVMIEPAIPHLKTLLTTVPSQSTLEALIDAAISAILTAEGVTPADTAADRLAALQTLLAERRAKAFPMDGFCRKPLPDGSRPAQSEWDALTRYIDERRKVDEETRRLAALFAEALAIPAVDVARDPIACLLCGTADALTPERIAFLRTKVTETEAYKGALTAALEWLRRLGDNVSTVNSGVAAACPKFMTMTARERRDAAFRIERIRTLVGPERAPAVEAWLARTPTLARALHALHRKARALADSIAAYTSYPETLEDPDAIRGAVEAFYKSRDAFAAALTAYAPAEVALVERLNSVVDMASDTAGWQDLIDLARDCAAVRSVLIDRHARTALQHEVSKALGQIDKANGEVLDDKFRDLSGGIQHWWDLLRPGEPVFFSGVMPRKGARRTIDFKAGLSLQPDRSAPKLRDVIAIFSQSQLHCLGLALFIARTLHEGAGFMILDDPILASDEDYRAYFKANVLEELIDAGIQVILLTQDQKTWKDLQHRYLHKNIDMYQLTIEDHANGTIVTNTADNLMAMLSRIEILARGGHQSLRKQAGEALRDAAERFCKEMLVNERWAKGEAVAAISDYDGKNLGVLSPQVEPLLTADPSHPGKLRSIANVMNPASHDDDIPDQGTVSVALGDLRFLKKAYLPPK